MISKLLGIVITLVQVINFAVLIYCVLTMIMPQSALVAKARPYIDPILAPFRKLLYRFFPKLRNLPLDFSPIVLWLAVDVLVWVVNLLR
ncbi:MAG: YggT family protein [Clostridia bacterium]